MTSYLTLAHDGTGLVEDRGSRFVAVVRRVGDEDAARDVVASARREHPDARLLGVRARPGRGGAALRRRR